MQNKGQLQPQHKQTQQHPRAINAHLMQSRVKRKKQGQLQLQVEPEGTPRRQLLNNATIHTADNALPQYKETIQQRKAEHT
jgi:hypothetical protein